MFILKLYIFSFLVCYETDPPDQDANPFITKSCGPDCGFYISGKNEYVAKFNNSFSIMEPPDRKEIIEFLHS